MKNKLLSFLFLESTEADAAEGQAFDARVAENLDKLFEAAAETEAGELESKKTPLAKALGEIGLKDPDLEMDPDGFCLYTDNAQAFSDMVTMLTSADTMHKLAELGWVVLKPGDDAMTSEPPHFRIRFLEIATVETGDREKSSQDQEEIVKKAQEFATTPMDRDDDQLNPVENDDGKMGKRDTGVGDAKDGSDPEGKPKGSTGKVPESIQEMTSTGSMGTLEGGGPQFMAGYGLVKKPKPYGKGTPFKTPGQWKVKQPVVDKQIKRSPQSEARQPGTAEEFLAEPLPEALAPFQPICQQCRKPFEFTALPESRMGCVKCPHCGSEVDQEGNVV